MKKILVVFGGQSVEHDISIITGQFIMAALKAASDLEPVPLYIAKNGGWYSHPSLGNIETFKQAAGDYDKHLASLRPAALDFQGGLTLRTGGLRPREARIDVVFPAMHGTNGEDGSLMGLLRMAKVPFVGCDLEASVIAMDKVLAKQVLAEAGIMSVPYVWFLAEDWQKSRDELREQIAGLKYPLFVKPAHLGSSIGVTRVDEPQHLEQAVEVALHYDDKVLVEQGVKDLMEINCAVLGNHDIQTSELEQPLTRSDFLSFEDKYIGAGKGGSMSGAKASTKIPANVGEDVAVKVKELAILAFKTIGGSGTARLDFLHDLGTKDVYLNEINPLPGSLQQHLWKASGVSNMQLVERLVDLAEEKFNERKRVTSTFSSSVLSQSGGNKRIQ